MLFTQLNKKFFRPKVLNLGPQNLVRYLGIWMGKKNGILIFLSGFKHFFSGFFPYRYYLPKHSEIRSTCDFSLTRIAHIFRLSYNYANCDLCRSIHVNCIYNLCYYHSAHLYRLFWYTEYTGRVDVWVAFQCFQTVFELYIERHESKSTNC